MIKILFIILFIGSVLSCTGPKQVTQDLYEQVSPKISTSDAIQIATTCLENKIGKDQFIHDSVTVWEWPINIKNWYVSFKKPNWESIIPSTIVVEINKINGSALIMMQK